MRAYVNELYRHLRHRADPTGSLLVVAPVTTTIRNIPTEVGLGVGGGLPRSSAANFDKVFTLRRSRFKSRITRLGNDRLAEAMVNSGIPNSSPSITRLGNDRVAEACRAYRFAAGC